MCVPRYWFMAHAMGAASNILLCFEYRVSHASDAAISQHFIPYGGFYSFGDSAGSHDPSTLNRWWREVVFVRFGRPTSDTVDCKSVVHIKPVASGTVIGYQVDTLKHILSVEYFVALLSRVHW